MSAPRAERAFLARFAALYPEQFRKRARSVAEQGMEAYRALMAEMTVEQKRALGKAWHDENLYVAEQADMAEVKTGEQPDGTLVTGK
jgi:hypothetical protein